MPLQTLPTELILNILSYLRPQTIERLAKTFNKRLIPICLPLLEDRIATQRNANRMIATFLHEPETDGWDAALKRNICGIWDHFRLERKWGSAQPLPSTEKEPFTNLDFLNLRGKFNWLADWSELKEEDCVPFEHYRNFMSEEQVAQLKTQAEKLGLEFPKGFFDFMRIVEEECHVTICGNAYFNVKSTGGLKKVRYRRRKSSKTGEQIAQGKGDKGVNEGAQHQQNELEEMADGYLLRFYMDQQGCYYWSLFLDAGPDNQNQTSQNQDGTIATTFRPGHCVIGSPGDPASGTSDDEDVRYSPTKLTPLERELGIGIADLDPDDIELQGTSFEEFVARTYFEMMCVLFDPKEGSRLPRKLLLYLVGVYSEMGRALVARTRG